MDEIEKKPFLSYYCLIEGYGKKVEVLIGALRAEGIGNGGFRLNDLNSPETNISKQAIKDALKGKGRYLRVPGSPSDLVRQNAALMLGLSPDQLWSNLYSTKKP